MPRPFASASAAALLLVCLAAAAPQSGTRRTAGLGGVSLSYDTRLAPEVRASLAPAAPLESATDKPDWFWPERVAFDLSAAYPDREPGRPVEIYVCAVEDFRRAASVSKELEASVGRTLRDLGRFLRRRSPAPAGEVPTVPFPDAHEAFRAHLKYLSFKRGTGVAYLTQAQQDESLINNQQLTYEFRGLTSDGRHYVYASFPVAAPFLPATADTTTYEGFTLPYLTPGGSRRAKDRAYRAYVARTRARLQRLRPDGFTPSLRLLDEMLSSLDINK